MSCPESSSRVQAYFDGELDALSAADAERHIEGCAECRALLADLQRLRGALRRDLPFERAPPELRARVSRALDAAAPGRGTTALRRDALLRRIHPGWVGALGGIGGAAIAAGLAFVFLARPADDALLGDLASAHIRSLMGTHLIDVQSEDRHTVKPWFAGHADVSPAVADFSAQGYRLLGGRVDYVDRRRSAVIVYQHGAHIINVFSWAALRETPPDKATRNGYRMACWQAGNLDYCAVSDTGWDKIEGLERLMRDASAANDHDGGP